VLNVTCCRVPNIGSSGYGMQYHWRYWPEQRNRTVLDGEILRTLYFLCSLNVHDLCKKRRVLPRENFEGQTVGVEVKTNEVNGPVWSGRVGVRPRQQLRLPIARSQPSRYIPITETSSPTGHTSSPNKSAGLHTSQRTHNQVTCVTASSLTELQTWDLTKQKECCTLTL
jgi:hypothetical protein